MTDEHRPNPEPKPTELRAAFNVVGWYLAKFGNTISPASKAGVTELSEYLLKRMYGPADPAAAKAPTVRRRGEDFVKWEIPSNG